MAENKTCDQKLQVQCPNHWTTEPPAYDRRYCVLSWQENCVDFENSRWFSSLLHYGDTTNDDGVSADDVDMKLIPSIVEKLLLAKLTGKTCDFQLLKFTD